MTKPNIQINDEVREMTEEEVQALRATGWTMEANTQPMTPTTPDDIVIVETPEEET